jgi:hypothetical protein
MNNSNFIFFCPICSDFLWTGPVAMSIVCVVATMMWSEEPQSPCHTSPFYCLCSTDDYQKLYFSVVWALVSPSPIQPGFSLSSLLVFLYHQTAFST